jgi:hypothetical protein
MGVDKVSTDSLKDDVILCYQCIHLMLENFKWICQISGKERSIKNTCKSPLKTRRN